MVINTSFELDVKHSIFGGSIFGSSGLLLLKHLFESWGEIDRNLCHLSYKRSINKLEWADH
jgi:hypothetical protein